MWNGDENFSRRGGFGRIPSLSAFRACGGPLVSLRVRRSHPFHRAGGSFFRRGGAARPPKRHARRPRCGGSPCCGRARPPDAAERPYTPVTGPYIYRHAKRPKSCTRFAFFPKNFFVPLWMRTKFFASRWDGDGNGEKRAAARWGNRSVVPQGMGIKMGRKRAARPPGRLGRNGRSARRVAGGLGKNGEKAGGGKRAKRGAGPARSETRSARAPRDGKRPAERGGSGRRSVGRVRRASARRARKGAKKRRLAPALLGWFVRSCAMPQRAVKGRGGDPVQQISAFRPGMRAEALVSSSRPTRLA